MFEPREPEDPKYATPWLEQRHDGIPGEDYYDAVDRGIMTDYGEYLGESLMQIVERAVMTEIPGEGYPQELSPSQTKQRASYHDEDMTDPTVFNVGSIAEYLMKWQEFLEGEDDCKGPCPSPERRPSRKSERSSKADDNIADKEKLSLADVDVARKSGPPCTRRERFPPVQKDTESELEIHIDSTKRDSKQDDNAKRKSSSALRRREKIFTKDELERITPYSYLIATGILNDVKKIICIMAKERPRIPFECTSRSADLFMGYYFKSQNIKAASNTRQKYRTAMIDMIKQKKDGEAAIKELRTLYSEERVMKEKDVSGEVLKKMEEFLALSQIPLDQRILIPPSPFPNGVILSLQETSLVVDPQDPEVKKRIKQLVKFRRNNMPKDGFETFYACFEKEPESEGDGRKGKKKICCSSSSSSTDTASSSTTSTE